MSTQTSTINVSNRPISTSERLSVYRKFIAWADKMDYYRLIILVGTILFQGCVAAPFAMWSMDAVLGYDVTQMTIITLSSFAILVTNLSVQPMRVTIPVFIISTLAQFVVIVMNVIVLW